MHIPDSMLQGSICSVSAIVSVVSIIAASYFGLKDKNKPTAARFAAITALIFAAQMMNFPIMNGSSGHLLGGVLAASLLGTPFAVLAIALVLAIQSLVFSDGGITVLGANIFNMAILGAGLSGMLRSKLVAYAKGRQGEYAATAFAAWFSVVVASFAVSVELAVSGQIEFSALMPAMLGTHALIGIGEAFITIVCLMALPVHNMAEGSKMQVALPLSAAVFVALLLSPFASALPDGFEWIAGKYNFMHQSAPAFAGIFPDYTISSIDNEMLSTGLAGLVGVICCFGLAWISVRIMETRATKQIIA